MAFKSPISKISRLGDAPGTPKVRTLGTYQFACFTYESDVSKTLSIAQQLFLGQ